VIHGTDTSPNAAVDSTSPLGSPAGTIPSDSAERHHFITIAFVPALFRACPLAPSPGGRSRCWSIHFSYMTTSPHPRYDPPFQVACFLPHVSSLTSHLESPVGIGASPGDSRHDQASQGMRDSRPDVDSPPPLEGQPSSIPPYAVISLNASSTIYSLSVALTPWGCELPCSSTRASPAHFPLDVTCIPEVTVLEAVRGIGTRHGQHGPGSCSNGGGGGGSTQEGAGALSPLVHNLTMRPLVPGDGCTLAVRGCSEIPGMPTLVLSVASGEGESIAGRSSVVPGEVMNNGSRVTAASGRGGGAEQHTSVTPTGSPVLRFHQLPASGWFPTSACTDLPALDCHPWHAVLSVDCFDAEAFIASEVVPILETDLPNVIAGRPWPANRPMPSLASVTTSPSALAGANSLHAPPAASSSPTLPSGASPPLEAASSAETMQPPLAFRGALARSLVEGTEQPPLTLGDMDTRPVSMSSDPSMNATDAGATQHHPFSLSPPILSAQPRSLSALPISAPGTTADASAATNGSSPTALAVSTASPTLSPPARPWVCAVDNYAAEIIQVVAGDAELTGTAAASNPALAAETHVFLAVQARVGVRTCAQATNVAVATAEAASGPTSGTPSPKQAVVLVMVLAVKRGRAEVVVHAIAGPPRSAPHAPHP